MASRFLKAIFSMKSLFHIISKQALIQRFSIFTLLLLALAMPSLAPAQGATFPLQGKTVGVYFTRKYFNFDDTYRIPLSQFIMSDQGAEIDIEDLKSQTLISLGSLFSDQLDSATQADSVYFLNESPELAREFLNGYDADAHQLAPMEGAFKGTDLILVVNPLVLGSYKSSSVYSRSNRIVTEMVIVRTARVRLEVFDPHTGLMLYKAEACMDERYTSIPEALFEFHMKNSQTGKFLGRLFSLAVTHLNLGIENNCPPN